MGRWRDGDEGGVPAGEENQLSCALWAGWWHLARDGGGLELSAGGIVGADGAIVRFEGPTALEVARHAPHRLLEHLADFTGSEMSELLACERCSE